MFLGGVELFLVNEVTNSKFFIKFVSVWKKLTKLKVWIFFGVVASKNENSMKF